MENFNYNDFVSDIIPGCVLTNSSIVKKLVEFSLQDKGTIKDIYLAGLFYQKELLLEWHATIEIDGHQKTIPLPIYFSPIKSLALQQIEKHLRAAHQKEIMVKKYNPGDYFLIDYTYPCQLVCDENGILYIKRFTIIPSQRIAQELLTDILGCDFVTATLVITTFHNLAYKGMNDIGWLLNLDGTPSMISIDRVHTNMGIFFIDKYEEILEGQTFELNYQKYVVESDDENGIYIAKLSKKGRQHA